MNNTVTILKEEEQAMMNGLKKGSDKSSTPMSPLEEAMEKMVQARLEVELAKALQKMVQKVQITGQPRVLIDFPDEQKVSGKVEVEKMGLYFEQLTKAFINSVLKIQGVVKANVDFPDEQKVSGEIKAHIKNFPDLFKVSGDVKAEVDFTKIITSLNEFSKILPISEGGAISREKNNPQRYIPVRLTNGRGFYDLFQTIGGSMGQVAAAIRDLISSDQEAWDKKIFTAQKTTVQTVKPAAGRFGGYMFYNPNDSVAYIQVFDKRLSGDVTLGTTVPDMIYPLPAGSAANIEMKKGVRMANGIQIACATTATGSGAPTTGLDLTIYHL